MANTENYIMLNGKRVDLTDEQLKTLGLYEKPKKSPFSRAEHEELHYYIGSDGKVNYLKEVNLVLNKNFYNIANYCTDKELMQQRALHETLNRLLWRFSMENGGDQINWNDKDSYKYLIYYDKDRNSFDINFNIYCSSQGVVHFNTKEIAEKAIKEIILPFMEQHPEFVW